ncbi:Conserved_hypothetical protein [Hexamita inflata]|uniref:Uncharacterized protein n=1 Tax=Hexamita inflata TaxID=28002 RepID=A0AA86NXI8_9EUKA|nr:Conserved hypothetical protein [Hexamita inflata]
MQSFASQFRPKSATQGGSFLSSRPNSANVVQSQTQRPSTAGDRPKSSTSKFESIQSLKQQVDKSQLSKFQNISSSISMKAHPMEIVSAYEKMLQKEAETRGVSYDLNIVNAMGNEIQCLRKEKNKLENELKMQKVETRKREQEIVSLQRELEQLAKRPQLFDTKTETTAMKKKETEPTAEYVKALKLKLKELYDANTQLEEHIGQIKDSTKVQKLQELEKHFRVYYERYNQLRIQNTELLTQIKDLQEENQYLKQRIEFAEINKAENQQQDVNYSLLNEQDQVVQLQREQDQTTNLFEQSEDEFDLGVQEEIEVQQPKVDISRQPSRQFSPQESRPELKTQNNKSQFQSQNNIQQQSFQQNQPQQSFQQPAGRSIVFNEAKKSQKNLLTEPLNINTITQQMSDKLPPAAGSARKQQQQQPDLRGSIDQRSKMNQFEFAEDIQKDIIVAQSQAQSQEYIELNNNTNPMLMNMITANAEEDDQFDLSQNVQSLTAKTPKGAGYNFNNFDPSMESQIQSQGQNSFNKNYNQNYHSKQSFESVKVDQNMFDQPIKDMSFGSIRTDQNIFEGKQVDVSYSSVKVDQNMFDAPIPPQAKSFSSVKVDQNMFDAPIHNRSNTSSIQLDGSAGTATKSQKSFSSVKIDESMFDKPIFKK